MVKLPKYVIFLFKRFDFIKKKKINTFIKYTEKLKLSDKHESKVRYKLSGVVIHNGSLTGGHYSAVGNKQGNWVYFNDSNVKEIKRSQALKKDAYILFYRRADA